MASRQPRCFVAIAKYFHNRPICLGLAVLFKRFVFLNFVDNGHLDYYGGV